MKECIFSITQEDGAFLRYLEGKLRRSLHCGAGAIAYTERDGRAYLNVAYDDAREKEIERVLLEGLCEIFAVGYKKQYLTEALQLRPQTLLQKTLLNAMSIFDVSRDKRMLLKQLRKHKNSEDFSLDGFYHFRLQALKQNWDEIVDATQNNQEIIYDRTASLEFLNYLLEAVPSLCKEITAKIKEGLPKLKDERGRRYAPLVLWENDDAEEITMYNLMCISPRTVRLKREEFSHEFYSLANELFTVEEMPREELPT